MVRLHSATLAALDTWISQQSEPPSRPEAIRQLIEPGLSVATARKPKRSDARSRAVGRANAKRAATDYINNVLKDQPEDVRAERKKRLTTLPAGVKRR